MAPIKLLSQTFSPLLGTMVTTVKIRPDKVFLLILALSLAVVGEVFHPEFIHDVIINSEKSLTKPVTTEYWTVPYCRIENVAILQLGDSQMVIFSSQTGSEHHVL